MRRLGLIAGRHDLPVEEFIFDKEIENPCDFRSMQAYVIGRFHILGLTNEPSIEVYVTGLTAAAVTVINIARLFNIDLVFMHFDRSTGKYVAQYVYSGLMSEDDKVDLLEASAL